MKMSNYQMLQYVEVLSTLKEKGKLGYAIARNTRKVKEAATEYIEAYTKLFKEHGEENADGTYSVPASDFEKELGEIKDIEHDVDIYTVEEDVFFGGNLTSAQMEQLLWMVKEG